MDVNEMEKHVLYAVFGAAKKLMEWSADDWDDAARQDFDALKVAVRETEQFLKLKNDTERAARAQSYQNMASI